jgi:hypothetical protein
MKQAKTVNLKPCPCCGGDAHVSCIRGLWKVICFACRLQTTGYLDDRSPVSSWNRRIPRTPGPRRK